MSQILHNAISSERRVIDAGDFLPFFVGFARGKKMGIWRIVNKKLGGFRNDFPGRKGKSLCGITGLDEKMKDSNRNKRQLCGLLSMVRSAQARLYFLCLPPPAPRFPPPAPSPIPIAVPAAARAGGLPRRCRRAAAEANGCQQRRPCY